MERGSALRRANSRSMEAVWMLLEHKASIDLIELGKEGEHNGLTHR